MLQPAHRPALLKREQVDPIDDSDFLFIDFDPFDEPTDNLHPCRQIGAGEAGLDPFREHPETGNRFLKVIALLSLASNGRQLLIQRGEALPCLLEARLELLFAEEAVLVGID